VESPEENLLKLEKDALFDITREMARIYFTTFEKSNAKNTKKPKSML
jgi:ATP/ADP translocase